MPSSRYEYTPKRGQTFTLTAEALVRRLVALTPPAKPHLTSFHGVYPPHSSLRACVMAQAQGAAENVTPKSTKAAKQKSKRRPRVDWATLHQHTFGPDVLRCPCGGTRSIRALYSTPSAAEERLEALGIQLDSRVLPQLTGPPQLAFAV